MNQCISSGKHPFPPEPSSSAGGSVPVRDGDPRIPLSSLSAVRLRMDSVQQFLSQSLSSSTLLSKDQMDMVSTEIVSAIHQIIVNGTALFSFFHNSSNDPKSERSYPELPVQSPINPSVANLPEVEVKDEKYELEPDCKIVELHATKLLAEHVHFCGFCGKGFKRDANLRMHMRAHGNQFKTPEALARPKKCVEVLRQTRFSCPFEGCNRNKGHKKFRPLKSVICVKNHFKRSHCPKMYTCSRCNKKSFSVLADLKSHLKHCGESKWRCSCGTSFSKKDKLFGHMAVFKGHMPVVAAATATDEKASGELDWGSGDDDFFHGLLDGFG